MIKSLETLSSARTSRAASSQLKILPDVCQQGWTLNPSNCRCYKYVATPTTWTEANRICQRIAPINSLPNPPVTRTHFSDILNNICQNISPTNSLPNPQVVKRHLASIANSQENNFVADLAGGNTAFIGGAQLREGSWIWTDGQEFDFEDGFSNWSLLQPDNWRGNESCMTINGPERGLWNDVPKDQRFPFVCQYLDLTKLNLCRSL